MKLRFKLNHARRVRLVGTCIWVIVIGLYLVVPIVAAAIANPLLVERYGLSMAARIAMYVGEYLVWAMIWTRVLAWTVNPMCHRWRRSLWTFRSQIS